MNKFNPNLNECFREMNSRISKIDSEIAYTGKSKEAWIAPESADSQIRELFKILQELHEETISNLEKKKILTVEIYNLQVGHKAIQELQTLMLNKRTRLKNGQFKPKKSKKRVFNGRNQPSKQRR